MAEIPLNTQVDYVKNSTPLPASEGLTFQRRDFLQIGGTNREIDAKGRETGATTSESILITAKTTALYTNFMTNHFEQLLAQKDLDTMIDNDTFMNFLEQKHPHEAKVLSLITTEDGTKVDPQKLKTLLKTSKGMMIATQLLEDVTAQKLFMLGLSAIQNHERKMDVADEQKIKLGIGQGEVNKLLEKLGLPSRGALINTGMVGALAGAGALLANKHWSGEPIYGINAGIVGAAAGGTAGILIGLLGKGVRSGLNEGVVIDLKRNPDGLKMLKNNPEESAYLRAMTGVDLGDFEIIGEEIKVIDKSKRVAESTRNPDDLRVEILQGLYARSSFLKDLGIDPTKVGVTAEQRFVQGRFKDGSVSLENDKMGTNWERMIEKEFKPNQGGILDVNGRKPGELDFNIDELDTEGNLSRFFNARRFVIEKMTNSFITEQLEREAKKREDAQEKKFSRELVEASQKIDSRITTLRDPKTIKVRSASLDAESTQLTARSAEIEAQLQSFEGSNEGRRKQEDIATEIQNRFSETITSIDNIDSLIADVNNQLNEGNTSLNFQLKKVEDLISEKYLELLERYSTKLPSSGLKTQPSADYTKFRELAEHTFKQLKDPILQKINAAESRRAELLTLRKQYEDANVLIAKANQEQSRKAQVDLQLLSYRLLYATEARLYPLNTDEIKSLPFEELVTKAMKVEEPLGSKLYKSREEAARAMIEARSELIAEVEEEKGQFDDAQKRVRRFRILLQSETQYIREKQASIQKQKESIAPTIQQEIARLEAYKAALPNIQDISNRQGEIFSEAREELMENLGQYINKTKVDSGNGKFTTAEQNANQPEGYYHMLNLIFKYQEAPNREELFQCLVKILPADNLKDMLAKYLLTTPVPSTLSDVFTDLENNKTSYAKAHYRQVIKGIINELRQQALALASSK